MAKRKIGNFWMLLPKQKSSYSPLITRLFTDEASAGWHLKDLKKCNAFEPQYDCCEVEVRRVKNDKKDKK